MTNFMWAAGRTLQMLALIQTGAALFIGISSNDPTLELKLLLLGVLEFLVGLFLVKRAGSAQ